MLWPAVDTVGRHKVAMVADIPTVKLLSVLAFPAVLCSLALGGLASAQAVPLPRTRPAPISIAEPTPEGTTEEAPPSACRLRLTAGLAVAPPLPALMGPGEFALDDAGRPRDGMARPQTPARGPPPPPPPLP